MKLSVKQLYLAFERINGLRWKIVFAKGYFFNDIFQSKTDDIQEEIQEVTLKLFFKHKIYEWLINWFYTA